MKAVIKIFNFFKLVVVDSGVLLVDVMRFRIGCFEVTVFRVSLQRVLFPM